MMIYILIVVIAIWVFGAGMICGFAISEWDDGRLSGTKTTSAMIRSIFWPFVIIIRLGQMPFKKKPEAKAIVPTFQTMPAGPVEIAIFHGGPADGQRREIPGEVETIQIPERGGGAFVYKRRPSIDQFVEFHFEDDQKGPE